MSNYQARRRAIRAERAALRCEQMVDEMRRQCRRREQQIYSEMKDRFDTEHQCLMAQLEYMGQAVADVAKFSGAQRIMFVGDKS